MIERKDFLSLLERRILLSDGAMGTMLLRGTNVRCPDILNLDKDGIKRVINVHIAYLEAGSDIIQTNTFSSNPSKLQSCGLDSELELINKNAVMAAKEAISIYFKDRERDKSDKTIFVAGNIGPTGKLLEPFGPLTHAETVDIFAKQIEVLLLSGVDLILIETMMDLNEALAGIEAARKISDKIPVLCTMTFGENGVTMMGNKAEDVIRPLLEAGCDVAGANCSLGSDKMLEIVAKMRSSNPEAKLMFQPNAGLPILRDGETFYSETPEFMASNIKKYLPYKPSILGACCGSTPEHIRRISEVIEK
ncbi:MAG: homocysteine S-methyltransferase family protein [Actinobacteria bacterium]|nr:homocysteine S-methyltransferase family protein [Actinomycetota bacterium]